MKRIMVLVQLLLGCAFTAFAGGYNYVEQGQFRQWLEKGN